MNGVNDLDFVINTIQKMGNQLDMANKMLAMRNSDLEKALTELEAVKAELEKTVRLCVGCGRWGSEHCKYGSGKVCGQWII